MNVFTEEERVKIRASFNLWRLQVGKELGIEAWANKFGRLQFVPGSVTVPLWGKRAELSRLTGIDKSIVNRLFSNGNSGVMFDAAVKICETVGGEMGLWFSRSKRQKKTDNPTMAQNRLTERLKLFGQWAAKIDAEKCGSHDDND